MESRVVGARGWGVSVSGGAGCQCFLQGEKVPEADGGDRGAKQREPAQRHRTARLGWGAAVRSVAGRSVACYCRSQFKKMKMKKEEEKHIASFGEDRRHAADERGPGRPGAGVGPYAPRRYEGPSRGPLERRLRAGDPAPGSGDTATASRSRQGGASRPSRRAG